MNPALERVKFPLSTRVIPLLSSRPMIQQWNIRSRAHECALTHRPFEDGERHYTAIYFDNKTGEYTRRDVAADAWAEETRERKPFSFWKTLYEKHAPDEKAEITPKESALSLLQRLIEDDQRHTENARYILVAMLERKRVLSPTAEKETEQGKMLFYENKKTGDVYVVRDPELRLDEVEGVQEEVATLLGFGGPGIEPSKVHSRKDSVADPTSQTADRLASESQTTA